MSLFRGWHVLESASQSPIEPIDIDVADPSIEPFPFRSRQHVVDELARLHLRIPPEHSTLARHVRAAETVLREIERPQFSLADYIRRTVQVPISRIPEANIQHSRDDATAALHQFLPGGSLADPPPDPDPKVSIPGALDTARSFCRQLGELLHMDSAALHFDVQYTPSTGYWKSWTSGTPSGGLLIRFNMTPRQPYFRGEALSLALHEVAGHAFQMAVRSEFIRTNRLENAYGISGVYGPEQFAFEGLAQTVPDWGESLGLLSPTPELRFARHFEQFCIFVYHNANCMLIEGASRDAVAQYIHSYLPAVTREHMDRTLADRLHHPIFRAYLFVYGLGDHEFSRVIRALDIPQLRDAVTTWYTVPMTPETWSRTFLPLPAT